MTIGEVVGAALRAARLRAGLSQTVVAARMDSHRPIVARIEAGRHDAALETIWRFAAAVGADPWAIVRELDRYRWTPTGQLAPRQQRRVSARYGR